MNPTLLFAIIYFALHNIICLNSLIVLKEKQHLLKLYSGPKLFFNYTDSEKSKFLQMENIIHLNLHLEL